MDNGKQLESAGGKGDEIVDQCTFVDYSHFEFADLILQLVFVGDGDFDMHHRITLNNYMLLRTFRCWLGDCILE